MAGDINSLNLLVYLSFGPIIHVYLAKKWSVRLDFFSYLTYKPSCCNFPKNRKQKIIIFFLILSADSLKKMDL